MIFAKPGSVSVHGSASARRAFQEDATIMFDSFLTKIFGSRNDRLVKQYRKRCAQINKLEPAMQALSDEELRERARARHASL